MTQQRAFKRRQFLRYLGAGTLTAAIATWGDQLQAQTVQIDLKALFLSRLDELIKLAEKPPVPQGVTFKFPTDSLKEAKKAFEGGKLEEVGKQLSTFSIALNGLRLTTPPGLLPFSMQLIVEILGVGLNKVIDALVLFSEKGQSKELKIHIGLYVSEDKKEEVFSPFLNECPKELKFIIGGKEQIYKLKECKSV